MRTSLPNRVLDLAVSITTLPVSAPIMLAGAIAVRVDSSGPAFFMHRRIGRGGVPFMVRKLRTMTHRPRGGGPSITAAGDARITNVGRLLRKTKLDEVPQLVNVLLGEMSIVGPRPEAPAYVDLDDERWVRVLSVRPGLTDLSSLTFRDEERVLDEASDSERAYREIILPRKLRLALEGVEKKSVAYDVSIMIQTALSIVGVHSPRATREIDAALDEVRAMNKQVRATGREPQRGAA